MMLLLIIAFGLVLIGITALAYRNVAIDSDELLVAGRDVGFWKGMTSVLATWAAPPAFLISSQVAYAMGVPGLVWFTIPNVLALVVLGVVAVRIKEKLPEGYTISQLFGERSRRLYAVSTGLTFLKSFISLVSFVVGGAAFLEYFSEIGQTEAVVAILLILVSYSVISGLGASMLTDTIQMAIIGVLMVVFIPWSVSESSGVGLVTSQLSVDTADGIFAPAVLLFGLTLATQLLTAPLISQYHWQRVYAIKKSEVKSSFLVAALLFAIIPVGFGMLGLIAASAEAVTVDNPLLAGFAVMETYLPVTVAAGLFLILVGALLSSGDSALVACGSIITTDVVETLLQRDLDDQMVMRVSMAVIAAIVAVSTVLPFSFLEWQLLNAPLGLILSIPILALLYTDRPLDDSVLFYAITLGMSLSFPVYVYGSLNESPAIQVGALGLGLVIVGVPILLNVFEYIGTRAPKRPAPTSNDD